MKLSFLSPHFISFSSYLIQYPLSYTHAFRVFFFSFFNPNSFHLILRLVISQSTCTRIVSRDNKSWFLQTPPLIRPSSIRLSFSIDQSGLESATLPRGPIGSHHLSDFRGGAASVGGSPALGFVTAAGGGTLRKIPIHHSPSIPISSNYVC